MARIKNSLEAVRTKNFLAERLRLLRETEFGERGGPELARKLGIPIRTWYNYEAGVTVPAEVVLRVVELTGVDPLWLLNGQGDRIKFSGGSGCPKSSIATKPSSAESLLRQALVQLETRLSGFEPETARKGQTTARDLDSDSSTSTDLDSRTAPGFDAVHPYSGTRVVVAQRNWADAESSRCVRVFGEDMAPVLGDGAYVAFSEVAEEPTALDGKLVVVWLDTKPIVRWYQHAGTHAILVAQNLVTAPISILIPLNPASPSLRVRRVLWVTTPH